MLEFFELTVIISLPIFILQFAVILLASSTIMELSPEDMLPFNLVLTPAFFFFIVLLELDAFCHPNAWMVEFRTDVVAINSSKAASASITTE